MVQKLMHFLMVDIWRIRLKKLPLYKYILFKPIRIFLLALRGFAEDKCQLRASALTFYSLLSIVPVMAMIFGIAKGFGFEKNLDQALADKLQGQEEIFTWISDFAHSFLANTQGGLIAGVGITILFWTVIKVLSYIEKSFNDIWGVIRGRTLVRKLTDYLSIMLICPVLLILSSSMTVFITSHVVLMTEKISFLGSMSPLIFFFLKFLPYCFIWILLTFLYIFMPNTKVRFRSAFIAGVLAGTLYQLTQWIYLFFQIGVVKYNAIYGSFAALPLFLIWLQLSWLVVLFGAEISFAVDNEETYEFEKDCLQVSRRFKNILSLRIVELCVKNFNEGAAPLDSLELSHSLDAPIRLIREILFDLVKAGILSEVKNEASSTDFYQPALRIEKLTIKNVLDHLEQAGKDDLPMINHKDLEKIRSKLSRFDQLIVSSQENIPLLKI